MEMHTIIEHYRFSGTPWEEELPGGLRRAWLARLEIGPVAFLRALTAGLPLRLGGGEITVQRTGPTLETAQVSLRLVCPETGTPACLLEHELCFQEESPQAHIAALELPWRLERVALAEATRIYDRLGIPHLRLEASGELGYLLAKSGFKPHTEEDAWELYRALLHRLEQVEVTCRTRAVVARLLEGCDPETVWAVSDLEKVRVVLEEGRMPLARALLADQQWPASLDLDDPIARARFHRFVRRGG
jgi:hypothetical protein